jgi:translation initiation factor IF-2
VFKVSKVGTIAGCMVRHGTIPRTAKVRLVRDGALVYTGGISSLKRFKDDVKEVREGLECGIGVENFNDVKVGDRIEAFRIDEVKRTLQSAAGAAS